MTEWFILDTEMGVVVQVFTMWGGPPTGHVMDPYPAPRYVATTTPPRSALERYRYWDERP